MLVRDLSDLWFSLKDDNSPTPVTRGQELSALVELHRRDDIRWITDKNGKGMKTNPAQTSIYCLRSEVPHTALPK